MKSTTQRLHGLDTLRSLAIVSVVIFHVLVFGGEHKIPQWLEPVVQRGWIGVDLFFVLSGFLIGSQLLRPYARGERPELWNFYRNRLFRVLPAYVLVLALYAFVPAWRETSEMAPAWTFLTFTLNLFIGRFDAFAFSHAWSLCVEEHFYLVLPLIVLLAMRRASWRKTAAVITGFTVAGLVVRAAIWFYYSNPQHGPLHYLTQIYYPTYTHFDGLAAGVAIAAVRIFRRSWWDRIASRGHWTAAAGMVTVVGCASLFQGTGAKGAVGAIFGYPLLAMGLGLIVTSAMSRDGVLGRVRVPGVETLAMLAYSMYLTHKEVLHLVNRWFPALEQAGGVAWWAVFSACCLAASVVLYLAVERPSLKLRDRVAERALVHRA